MDWREAWHSIGTIRTHSRLKLGVIAAFTVLLPWGLYALFLSGLRFLTSLGGIGLMLVRPLFFVFFLGLGFLLVLSSAVIGYPAFFRSAETDWLRLTPLSPSSIALHRWFQVSALSAWAYFIVVIPFAAAYGRHEGYPARFTIILMAFSLPFVLLCGGLGVLSCLILGRWAPRGRRWRILMVGLLLTAFAAVIRPSSASVNRDGELQAILRYIAPGLRLASHPLWPSAWLLEGVWAAAREEWGRAAYWWGLLTSTAALAGVGIEAFGRRHLAEAWLRAGETAAHIRRRRLLRRWPVFLWNDWAAIATKELRLFLRDPVQWSQGIFFFALLAFYFLNLRTLHYHRLEPVWRDFIAILNVFSISAVVCSFASRFLYPQLSLEGQAIWILGLSPGGIQRAYRIKLGVAIAGLGLVAGALAALSSRMLQVDPVTFWAAVGLATLVSIAAAALSIGLGAVFLDLRERNPAAIVSGFGGTLNLVLNLAVMIGSTVPFGLLFHMRRRLEMAEPTFHRLLAIGLTGVMAVCLAVALVAGWLGGRALRQREF